MFSKFWIWFSSLFRKKSSVPLLPLPQPLSPEPKTLNQIWHDEIDKAHMATYEAEKELNDNAKLQKFIEKTIAEFAKGLAEKDKYNFVLVMQTSIGCKSRSYPKFALIFQKLAAEMGLPIEIENNHLSAQKKDLERVFNSKSNLPEVNVDERWRTMYSKGIYR